VLNIWRFLLIFIAFFLPILGQSHLAESGARFVDNGDGTVTDTVRKIMWQKGDNGQEVTFEQAQEYCQTLRLGKHADWRLPRPEERDTAVVIELMRNRHSPDTYSRFDLYWSSDPQVLLPFNYQPSYGGMVLRVYPARPGARAFVRAVRSVSKNP
jgi:hypothetical protein